MPYPRGVVSLSSLLLIACTSAGSAEAPAEAPGRDTVQPDAPPAATPDPAPDEDVWAAVGGDGEAVALCEAESKALADARAEYEALQSLVEGLRPDDSAEAFNVRANELLGGECFAVARVDEPGLRLDLPSAAAAKAYWESGLDMWFRTYLDLAAADNRDVWLLPSQRDVVTPQTHPDDPLAPWLCPQDPESSCARAVLAYAARAERYFELWALPGLDASVDCEPAAREGGYAKWRDCERDGLRRHAALALGGVGLVDEGWIVVEGRRGHYEYCDEVAAFDLSTGAYYRFAECDHRPELDGLADAGALGQTAAGVQVETGRVDLEHLREFAWATLSAQYVQPDVVRDTALGRQLPADMAVTRTDDRSLGGLGLIGMGSSGHTSVRWAWSAGAGKPVVSGDMSWPGSLSNPAEDHAVRLLSIAEGRAAPGCAPSALPDWVADGLVDEPTDAVREAIARRGAPARCK